MTFESSAARCRKGLLSALLGLVLVSGCGAQDKIDIGGETHFLKSCSPEENSCDDGLSCVCGVCTQVCDEQTACAGLSGATCVSVDDREMCGGLAPVQHCDVECGRDSDCSAVSAFHVCDEGVCRTESPPRPVVEPSASLDAGPPDAGLSGAPSSESPTSSAASSEVAVSSETAATSEASATSESTGADAASAPPCEGTTTIDANEVLIIGDAFFAKTHQTTGYLEDIAKAAGVLGEGERYRDGSRVVQNSLALAGENGILDQYTTAVDDGPVRVAIMTGGGADVLIAECDPIDSTCADLGLAAEGARAVLAAMADGGVEDVVYTYYPDAVDDTIRAKVDALRPLIQQACEEATLGCHWLDLRDAFDGHADYIAADGMLTTTEGAKVTAEAIWSVMQSECIAQ